MGSREEPALAPLPRDALLGHLRPADRYCVETIGTERRGDLAMTRYLVSGAAHQGADIRVSLRVCTADPAVPDIVFSIPGGGGSFSDDTLWWLADRFRANHAAVDWIGRGQSPAHDSVVCRYDPIFMESNDYRESFLFHNLAAIWAALNWLFATGARPVDLVGGSWGGVFCLLLAALDSRVERIFSSFGCGGFSLPGVEKRSMWDAAFEHMGAARAASWCRAFDPLLRMPEIGAGVYYETATNDKFFSIDMAMETWRRVRNPIFLGVLPNRDHDMRPFGLQPYIVQAGKTSDIARCRAITGQQMAWDPGLGEVACLSPADAEAPIRLFASEQLPAHGNMSREWVSLPAIGSDGEAVRFAVQRTHPDAEMQFFASGFAIGQEGARLHAATPIRTAGRPADDRRAVCGATYRSLLDQPGADPEEAPIGDKGHPAVRASPEGWTIEFGDMPRSRATRFGIRPWLLPPGWEAIEVTLAAPPEHAAECLDLVLSRRYQHLNEEAIFHPFRDAVLRRSGELCRFSFARAGFAPGVIVEQRFRRHAMPPVAEVLDDFDAVGIVDYVPRLRKAVVLVGIAIR